MKMNNSKEKSEKSFRLILFRSSFCCLSRDKTRCRLCSMSDLASSCGPSQGKEQAVANTAWAFASVKQPNVKLFMALARAVERHISELNAQELSNTAWAFATVRQPDKKLFEALAKAAERRVREFNAQNFRTLWAMMLCDRHESFSVAIKK